MNDERTSLPLVRLEISVSNDGRMHVAHYALRGSRELAASMEIEWLMSLTCFIVNDLRSVLPGPEINKDAAILDFFKNALNLSSDMVLIPHTPEQGTHDEG